MHKVLSRLEKIFLADYLDKAYPVKLKCYFQMKEYWRKQGIYLCVLC